MKRYLSVDIYTNGSDCSLHGLSSQKGKYFVVECPEGNWTEKDIAINPDAFGIFEFCPAVHNGKQACFKPSTKKDSGMFGGNFLWSSDSRFRKMYAHPMPIHDRYEW